MRENFVTFSPKDLFAFIANFSHPRKVFHIKHFPFTLSPPINYDQGGLFPRHVGSSSRWAGGSLARILRGLLDGFCVTLSD